MLKKLKQRYLLNKEQKKQTLRIKNDRLHAQGKSRSKGWGKMVNTGVGGLNKTQSMFDRQITLAEMQKQVAKNDAKPSNDKPDKIYNKWWFN